MLLSLHIENFALIDCLDLSFGRGLHVLTGETGAGKSIVLDALDAVLGGRVTSRAIRTGADRAIVEAVFRVDDTLRPWLADRAIAAPEGQLACQVEISASRKNGSRASTRSRVKLNGDPATKQTLAQLRERLVEITAQGQTTQLLDPEVQRDWLDGFGGDPLLQQRRTVAAAWEEARKARVALEKRRAAESQRQQQLDLFEYQFRELSAAQLEDPAELGNLEQERDRLAHAVDLQQQSYQVYQLLYAGDGDAEACADLLGKAEGILNQMTRYDRELEPILEMVSGALAQVAEAGQQINAYGDGLESDPDRLAEVEERIALLKGICRKYGPTLGEAIDRWHDLQAALNDLGDGAQSLDALESAYDAARWELESACARLSDLRQQAARDLESRLVRELEPLAMDRVQFQVQFAAAEPGPAGADRLAYCFSPNPGEPLQPLSETASGGEMSRFLLALKTCLSAADAVETLVFDEIDVGVSGRVAQAIAEKLHQLAQRHQVLCVTHQPIVAAMADWHFHVAKQVVAAGDGAIDSGPEIVRDERAQDERARDERARDEGGRDESGREERARDEAVRTVVRLALLDADRRRQELAHLASGEADAGRDDPDAPSGAAASAFAEALLERAARLRQSPQPAGDRPAPPRHPAAPEPTDRADKPGTDRSGAKTTRVDRNSNNSADPIGADKFAAGNADAGNANAGNANAGDADPEKPKSRSRNGSTGKTPSGQSRSRKTGAGKSSRQRRSRA